MSGSDSQMRFVIRPSPVLPEHRPIYKISQILLILALSSRGGKSSLPRLQLFSWAMKRPERQRLLTSAAEQSTLNVEAWGFDPALVIALKFAYAEKLISQITTGYEILDSGTVFVKEIELDAELFLAEKAFLKGIGKRITETMVDTVVESWKQK